MNLSTIEEFNLQESVKLEVSNLHESVVLKDFAYVALTLHEICRA